MKLTPKVEKVYDSYYELPDEDRRELLTLLMEEDDDGTVLKEVAIEHGLIDLCRNDFFRDDVRELAEYHGFDVYYDSWYDVD